MQFFVFKISNNFYWKHRRYMHTVKSTNKNFSSITETFMSLNVQLFLPPMLPTLEKKEVYPYVQDDSYQNT